MTHCFNKLCAFALMLIVLLPATAQQPDKKAPIFELNITASGSTFATNSIKVRLREGEVGTINQGGPGKTQYQYIVRAQRPAPDSLNPAAKRIVSPLAMSIRIDTSEDGKTWLLQSHANVLATLGSTVAVEMSDTDKSSNLIITCRQVPDAERRSGKQ